MVQSIFFSKGHDDFRNGLGMFKYGLGGKVGHAVPLSIHTCACLSLDVDIKMSLAA